MPHVTTSRKLSIETDAMGLDFPRSPTDKKRTLRRLELEAYASVVSAFRAQGPLTCNKKSTLDLLCKHLSVSAGRHRAEVRRAVNDDLLTSVAGCVSPYADDDKQWRKEGQKLAPSNGKFVSRPSNRTSQLFTAATLAATFAKTQTPVVPKSQDTMKLTATRPEQVTYSLDKKPPSLRVQNVLKYIIFQNPHGALARSQQLVRSPSKSPARSVQSAPVTPVKTLTPPIDKKLISVLSVSPQLTKVLSPLKALISATAQTSIVQTTSGQVGRLSANIKTTVKKPSSVDKGNVFPLNKSTSADRGLECDESLDSSPVTSNANSENAKTSHTDSNLRVILKNDTITLKTNNVLLSKEDEPLSSASADASEIPVPVVSNTSTALIADSTSREAVDDSESMVLGECEVNTSPSCSQKDSIQFNEQDTKNSEDRKQQGAAVNDCADGNEHKVPVELSPNKILSREPDMTATPISVHLTPDPGPTPLCTSTTNLPRLLDVCERKSVQSGSPETESNILRSTEELLMFNSESSIVNCVSNANSKPPPITSQAPLLVSQASMPHNEPLVPVTMATSQASETAVPVTITTSQASETAVPVTIATSHASETAVPVTIATSHASESAVPVTIATSQASESTVPVTIATSQASETAAPVIATLQASETAIPVTIATSQVSEAAVPVTITTSQASETTAPVAITTSQASDTVVPVTIATSQASETTAPVAITTSQASDTVVPVTIATSQASETTAPVAITTSQASETVVPVTIATSQASETTAPVTKTTLQATEIPKPVTMATSQDTKKVLSATKTTLSITSKKPVLLALSESRKRPALTDSLVDDITPSKRPALTDSLENIDITSTKKQNISQKEDTLLTKRVNPFISLPHINDVAQAPSVSCTNIIDTSKDRTLATLKSITDALANPPVIPDANSLLQSWCSVDPYSLEESELASELGLDSIDPALLTLSGLMDFFQLPGTPTAPQSLIPTAPMGIEVPRIESQPPTSPMGIEVLHIESQPPTSPMSIEVPHIESQPPTSPMSTEVPQIESQPPTSSMGIEIPQIESQPPTSSMGIEVSRIESQPPTSPMSIEVPHIESQTPTFPTSVDITLSVSGQAITSESVSVESPHLFDQMAGGKEACDISIIEDQAVTVSNFSAVMACEVDSISSSLGAQVKPAVTTSLPSTLPRIQFVPLFVAGSQTSIPIPVVAHHHFPSSLAIDVSVALQQPDLTRTVCPTTSPNYAVFSPLSLIQDGSGVSLVSSSGLRPIPSTSVTSQVVVACPPGSNASPPVLSSKGKEIAILSSKEEKMAGLLETPLLQFADSQPGQFPVSHQEVMVDLSSESSQLVQHKANVTSSPQQVFDLKHSSIRPKVLSTCPELLEVPSKPSPSAESQPVNLNFVDLTKEDPEVVQLIPKDVDILQRLSLEGAEISDIVGDVNEKELLEGIPLDLALAIQAIARIDEQDSAPWKQ